MNASLILNARGFGLAILSSLLFLTACSSPEHATVPPVEIKTIQIQKPAPIVPKVDQLNLRDINWKIITPSNVDEVFSNIQGEVVLFSLTVNDYESLALNLSDLRALIQQQKAVIAIYSSSYK